MNNMNMNADNFFGVPIATLKDAVPEEYNQKMINRMREIQEQTPNGSDALNCTIYTNFGSSDLTHDPIFSELSTVMKNATLAFVNAFASREYNNVTQGATWFNVSSFGDYQEKHIHPNAHISAIYYAKAPEGSGNTLFCPPSDNMFPLEAEFNNTVAIKPLERTLVLFLSNIPHLVDQQMIHEERISIASNFSLT